MGEAPNNDPLERFIAQFEWDGTEAVYRGNRTGAAYRVTADDYHRFVEDYDHHRRLSIWIFVVGWSLVFGAILFVPAFSALVGNAWATGLVSPALFGSFFALSAIVDRWLLLAPARALRRHPPIAAALSGDERLSRTIGEKSWRSLFREMMLFGLMLLFVIAALSVFGVDWGGWFVIALSIGAIGLTAMEMLRKSRFERRQNVAGQLAGSAC